MKEFKFENGWDYYSFTICSCYLSALINNDPSGLEDEEIVLFDEWYSDAIRLVHGTTSHHWDCDADNSYFGRDEVSGLMADAVDVRLIFKKDKENE